MCKIVEEYAKEYAKEKVMEVEKRAEKRAKKREREIARQVTISLIHDGVSDIIIHKATELPLEVIAELRQSCE